MYRTGEWVKTGQPGSIITNGRNHHAITSMSFDCIGWGCCTIFVVVDDPNILSAFVLWVSIIG